MHSSCIAILAFASCIVLPCIMAIEDNLNSQEANIQSSMLEDSFAQVENQENPGVTLNRQKRTLLLKKKLIGAGLLGFGLGALKGYKAAYYTASPQVHHVYVAPRAPSASYVEYVEKPVYIERIIERPAPAFKPIHTEYKESGPYGSW